MTATSIHTTNAKDKMTAKDYIFLQNIMHREKYSNITAGYRKKRDRK